MATSSTPKRAQGAVDAAAAITQTLVQSGNNSVKVRGMIFRSLLLLAMTTSLIAIIAIIAWAFVEGGQRLTTGLITNNPSSFRPETAGFRPAIMGTLQIIGGVIFLILPLGVGAALYLEQFANKERWYNRLIELNIQNLAGVPSIVFGILGLAFIVRGPLSLGFVAAAGSLTIALLVLPTVILSSREAIRAVPSSLLEGAMALGVTRWQAVWRMVLPAAAPGMLTGVILAVARAIGEAAPLLLVGAATFVTFDPNFWDGGYSALPVMIYQYAGRPQEEFKILAAAGVIVMLGIVVVVNSVAVWLRARYERSW
ncbi:MAG TPA: phosphate ABC transporter permease PstA [Microbacteriaceae bacterium]